MEGDCRSESNCGSTSLSTAAELANLRGNECYRGGNFEAAVQKYTEALLHLSSVEGVEVCANGDQDVNSHELRSKYHANRAQARMQLKDFELAAEDCRAAVSGNPLNAKALVRWGLCEQARGCWDEALRHFEDALTMLQPGTSLFKTVLEGGRRARANLRVDRKTVSFRRWTASDPAAPATLPPPPPPANAPVLYGGPQVAHEEAMPEELVHRDQILRLSFRDPLPTKCRYGEWFVVSVGLSNEFGLWRRDDFRAPTPSPPKDDGDAAASAANATNAAGYARMAKLAPCPASSASSQQSSGTAPQAGSHGNEHPTGLRLVIEARDLERIQSHFTGRGDARHCRRTRKDPHLQGGRGRDPSEMPSTANATAKNALVRALRDPGGDALGWSHRQAVVEVDGRQLIGADGRARFRARFLARSDRNDAQASSGCGEGSQPVTAAISDTVVGGPSVMLLRVSAVKDDAMQLLDRPVVPVLSLPILILDEAAQPASTGPSTVLVERAPLVAKHHAMASNAFAAGAVGCREVIVPAAIGGAVPSISPSAILRQRWQQQRWQQQQQQQQRHENDSNGCDGIAAASGGNTTVVDGVARPDGDGNDILDGSRGEEFREDHVVLVAESPGQLGIGGKVWDSAFVLCNYLAKCGAPAAATASDRDERSSQCWTTSSSAMCSNDNLGDLFALDHDAAAERVEADKRCMSPAAQSNGSVFAKERATRSRPSDSPDCGEADLQSTLAAYRADHRARSGKGVPTGVVSGKRVLELGAGTGVVSICCALLGASAVVATDFKVTELIRLNVMLNFPDSSPLLDAASPPRSRVADEESACASSCTQNLASVELDVGSREGASGAGASLSSRSSLPIFAAATHGRSECLHVRRSVPTGHACEDRALVSAVPLAWGERSAEVEAFGAELVVMSDVVYDPAGYEPLIQTLLDVMRPGMLAVMAHRHRHPEDHDFFRRLRELFCVREEIAHPSEGWKCPHATPPATENTTRAGAIFTTNPGANASRNGIAKLPSVLADGCSGTSSEDNGMDVWDPPSTPFEHSCGNGSTAGSPLEENTAIRTGDADVRVRGEGETTRITRDASRSYGEDIRIFRITLDNRLWRSRGQQSCIQAKGGEVEHWVRYGSHAEG